MVPELTIRRAKVEEARTIIDLHADTIRRVNSKDYTPEQIAAWLGNRRIEITEGMILKGEYFVAVSQGEVVGVGHLASGVIRGLYVSADHQSEGIGSALLQLMESDARSLGVSLMEIESTTTAETFYQTMGYRSIESRQIGNAMLDVVLMEKRL